jgi:hypothetical protein
MVDGGLLLASRFSLLNHGESPRLIHWLEDWMGLRVGLDDMEKRKLLTISGLEHRSLGPALANRHIGSATSALRKFGILKLFLPL